MFIITDTDFALKSVETKDGNSTAVEITDSSQNKKEMIKELQHGEDEGKEEEEEEEVVTSIKRTTNIRHNKDVKEAVRSIGMEKIKDQTVNNGISVSRNSSCNTTELIQAVRSASLTNIDKKHSDANLSDKPKISRKKTDENVIQVFRSYRYLGQISLLSFYLFLNFYILHVFNDMIFISFYFILFYL